MKKNDEFYVSYIDRSLGPKTKTTLKRFSIIALATIVIGALLFSFFQKPFKNSTFELTSATNITGTYYEKPYPMLRVEVAENTFKNILLLGFGKSSANPYLEKLQKEVKDLNGKNVSIEGNLIYYNGKTLIQITDDEKVILESSSKKRLPEKEVISKMTLTGEIIDPKCYFGVMKPGKGKIHRSCAVRCVSGGIPPVLATTDKNNISEYFLITDLNGKPINKDILEYIGKPSEITGIVEKMEDWSIIKIQVSDIRELDKKSSIY
ncbi:hypothetical protein [Spongiivirga citrea]|uniref:Uncharacterized protein n=1 Tax=Spongiivirga citrea TaxID=1481457 RepID=A0A6M0CGM8_9FLAO|nr:hypothetical protein [Spongiivirga citrea]NER16083.1 hypothetical protein [Spongiivirga citrea]